MLLTILKVVTSFQSDITNYNYEMIDGWGWNILLVTLWESLYNFRKFLVSWVSFTLFIMVFHNFAWIGFVLCFFFFRKQFLSFVMVCLFSWLGYYVVDNQPMWTSYPSMPTKDVAIDLIITLVTALFMMRAMDIYNCFLHQNRKDFEDAQSRLMLDDMVITKKTFNRVVYAMLGLFVLSFLSGTFYIFHRFDWISIGIGLLSWVCLVWPHKRRAFPIGIDLDKLVSWKKAQ